MSDVTVDVCPTSASRETMGAASRAWHHVAWGAIKAGTLRSIVLCCGSKRTSRKSSEKRLDKDLSFHKVYYAEECLQPSEFIAQYPKSTLC